MATPAQVAANQANSQKSTGPKSPDGKARSSRNSFKHGLYSKELVLPNEDPAELDQLRASLRAEHQPSNTTEEMLVNDIAENFWRLRRMREFETRAMLPENIINWHQTGLLAVVQRTMGSAERGFHKTLTALRRLQKDRGFVPLPSEAPSHEIGFVSQTSDTSAASAHEPAVLSEAKTQAKASVLETAESLKQKFGFVPDVLVPFLNESGSLSREGFRALAAHIQEQCCPHQNGLSEAA